MLATGDEGIRTGSGPPGRPAWSETKGADGRSAEMGTVVGLRRVGSLDPVQAAIQSLSRKAEGAMADLQNIRAILADPKRQRDEQRLGRIEQSVQEIAASNDLIAEMARSFEVTLSIGLVQRLNELIEERLTVVSAATRRLRSARLHARFWSVLCIILGALLALDIHDGRVAVAFYAAWSSLSLAMADPGNWIGRIVG